MKMLRKAMNGIGMEDWLIDGMMELYSIIKDGHAEQITNTVEQILGKKPGDHFHSLQKNMLNFLDKLL